MHKQAEFISLYSWCQNGNSVSGSWSRGLFLTAASPDCSTVVQEDRVVLSSAPLKAVTSSPLPAPSLLRRAAPTERAGSSLPDLYHICCFCLSWLPLPHAEFVLEVIQLNCFLQLLTLN